jgi:carboxypeptidase C (cathepsin A)
MVAFLRGWRTQFQEHASSGFILASESYGGKYVPAWTSAIMDYNARWSTNEPLQLVGIALGNGVINETIQNEKTFIEYAKKEKLIKAGDRPRSEDDARMLIEDEIGYEPNFYDFRLKDAKQWLFCPDCNSYDYTTYGKFLMKEEVTTALNVCGNAGQKAFGRGRAGCIDMPGFDEHDDFQYSAALARALQLGIPVVLFYGMQDTAVNYVGGHAVASTLEWTGASSFNAAPLEDMKIAGATVGKTKSVAGLTWMQIRGCGHMVPSDSPAAAFMALNTLLSDHTPNLV